MRRFSWVFLGLLIACGDSGVTTTNSGPHARSARSASTSGTIGQASSTLGSSVATVRSSEPAPEKEGPLHAKARSLVTALGKGSYTEFVAAYDDGMKKALPEDRLRKMWETLTTQTGPLTSIEAARQEMLGAYRVIVVTVKLEASVLDLKLSFDKKDRLSGFFVAAVEAYEAPTYADVDRFEESVVVVESGAVSLPGILTMPKGTGPFPAVVLVHDAGALDLDATSGPNKPFWDLAQGLASQGIAVLRYDKRTFADENAKAQASFTIDEETVIDAAAAAALIGKQPKIDPKRVYLVGHGLGGRVASRIASREKTIAGIVALGAPLRPIEDVAVSAGKHVASLDGTLAPDEEEYLAELELEANKVKSMGRGETTAGVAMGFGPAYWKAFATLDPTAELRAHELPVLMVFGERDYECTAADKELWQKGLEGAPKVTWKSYPTLNHLMMPGGGPSNPEEYRQAQHVSNEVVKDVAEWVKGRH